MTEQLVPTCRTAVDAQALYRALRDAWRAELGTEPSRASLLVLLAQSDFETGGWHACNNHNLAGIKHVAGDGHDYARYLTREFVGGQWATLAQNFRAYDSLEAAVSDYLHVLRTRFGFAWPAVESGDTADFAHRLRARGYYTAPESQYAAGLAARRDALAKRLPSDEDGASDNPYV